MIWDTPPAIFSSVSGAAGHLNALFTGFESGWHPS